MSIAVVALIVASLSALGTLANMTAAWASYRRGGPRLKVKVDYRPRVYVQYMDDEDPESWRSHLHVHVRNHSAAAVEVHEVVIVPSVLFRRLSEYRKYGRLLSLASLLKVEVIDGADQMSIPAFGGVRWVLDEKFTVMARPSWLASRTLLFQVQVTLTNGQEVRSRRRRYISAKRSSTLTYTLARTLREVAARRRAPVATLDDALRELEEQRSPGTD
ncbi:hypothetical protein [Streptomyces sp. SID5606]|uniref:hypothetical protein n=1 Tax=Streptomyces sp. SID5606 TaxID=2690305 RepID=UPI0013710CC3|nr:hypothetical protein [Streptomyces sp. SID5606]MZD52670.1 hypothetical protein [Streptomyces sp. SID5606]